MRRDWRRSESRVVRPFAGVEGCLGSVHLRLFSDAEWDDRTAFEVEQDRLSDVSPEFQLDIDKRAKREGRIESNRLSIVVTLRDLHLRRSEVVFEKPLKDVPEFWAPPYDVYREFAWASGVKATVALVLNATRRPTVGEPYLRGHWLERKVFLVRPRSQPHSFPVERWTAEDFAKKKLPKDTAYWVDFLTDDFNRRFDEPGEALRIAFRDDVFDALADKESSPSSRAILALIISEVATDILAKALETVESDELDRAGVLYAVLERIRKATGAKREELADYVKNGNRAALRAHVQAARSMHRDLAKAGRTL